MTHATLRVAAPGSVFISIIKWIAGPDIVVKPDTGDFGLENNLTTFARVTNPPLGADGARVEAAVAAFLYDLVDDGTERDSEDNQVGPAELFDNLAYPASSLAAVMRYCRVNNETYLSGVDQLVYCLEGNTSAYGIASQFFTPTAWRAYQTVSFESPVTLPDSVAVRRLWKYNLYGQQ